MEPADGPKFEAAFEAFDVSDKPFEATFETDFDTPFAQFESAEPAAAEEAPHAAAAQPEAVGDTAAQNEAQSAAQAEGGAEEEARREFELQRSRRLQQLEAQQQVQQQPVKTSAVSSSWGGWLSSMPSPAALRTLASERAASAAAALQSPAALSASLSSVASAAHSAAVEKEKELREAMKMSAEKLQQSASELQSSVHQSVLQSPVASLSSSLDTARRSLPAASFDWSLLSSSSGALAGSADGAEVGLEGGEESAADSAADGVAAAVGAAAAARPKRRSLRGLSEEEQFEVLFDDSDFAKAAWLAANSPKQMMRSTPERAVATIRRFEAAAATCKEGEQPPILTYFGALLKRSANRNEPLGAEEGIELARPVVAQGQVAMVNGWLASGRLRPSEALADVIREKDPAAAIKIFQKVAEELRRSSPELQKGERKPAAEGKGSGADAREAEKTAVRLASKLIMCYAELCDIDEVCYLCRERRPASPPDWAALLREMCALPGGVPRAIAFEEKLRAMPPPPPPPPADDELAMAAYKSNPPPPAAPTAQVSVGLFIDAGEVDHATKLAVAAVSADSQSLDGPLQTRLLESNLTADPQAGEALLEAGSFTAFDARQVAICCERAGRLPLALRLHPRADDLHRLLSDDAIDDGVACTRVGTMPVADALAAVGALLRRGTSRTLNKTLLIARTHAESLGHAGLQAAFEEHGSDSAVLTYLGSRMGTPSGAADPALTLSYLKASRKAGRADEVERVTRDPSATFDARDVLAFLQYPPPGAPPGTAIDPRPIINVCDRFDLVETMAAIFFEQKKLGHLSLYVRKIATPKAPQAVAGLLDAGCEPARAAELITGIDNAELAKEPTIASRLIAACDERGQLGMLRVWLKAREAEGLDEGTEQSSAVLAALKKLEPLKRLFG